MNVANASHCHVIFFLHKVNEYSKNSLKSSYILNLYHLIQDISNFEDVRGLSDLGKKYFNF